MTSEKKTFLVELLKSVAMVIIAGIVMGFIMRPSSNKDEIQAIKSDLRVEITETGGMKAEIIKHDDRIKKLEDMVMGVATKEDLQILKQDLIRELKR